jgi:uncharacterized protein YpmB
MEWWQIAAIILTIIVAVSGIVGVFYANAKNKLSKTTNDNYEKTIKSYKDIVEAEDQCAHRRHEGDASSAY